MSSDTTQRFHSILNRLRSGDNSARRELLDVASQRLYRLTAHIFSGSFPALAGRHEVDSIVHETWLRLAQALESVQPESFEHFLRLAAQKVRHVLLDLIDREKRHVSQLNCESNNGSGEPSALGGQTYDPARLAVWTEFHEKVATLPDDEKCVFEMHYYLELPQAEIAKLLDLHPRKVSRLWLMASDKLAGSAIDSQG